MCVCVCACARARLLLKCPNEKEFDPGKSSNGVLPGHTGFRQTFKKLEMTQSEALEWANDFGYNLVMSHSTKSAQRKETNLSFQILG